MKNSLRKSITYDKNALLTEADLDEIFEFNEINPLKCLIVRRDQLGKFDCQLDTLYKEYSTVDKLFMLETRNKLNGNYQLFGRQRRCKAGQSRPSFLLPAAAVAALSG
ncbi:hypothetical protein T11_16173 [Trichinella zimbabwensis]|uniref:Uncharacterized protein n=1 Tax=Trichinella zimbabwensis TaxID=268475 RepID=A0A0V1H379_9BILA|nr:hypothetical protein T11_16173 [Trichinella zimbabwensis]